VVGYEAFSGQRPFSGDGALTVAMKHVREAPPPMPEDLPPNVRELIEVTMTKDPTRRYRSGGEFAEAVAAVRAGHRPPPPRDLAGPAGTSTGAARVLPPPSPTNASPTNVGPTSVLPHGGYAPRTGPEAATRYLNPDHPGPGATTALPSRPKDDGEAGRSIGMTPKVIAALVLLALALGGLTAYLLLGNSSGSPTSPQAPPVTSIVAPSTTTAATTTEEPTTTRRRRPVPPPVTETPTTTVAPTTTPAPITTTPDTGTTTPPTSTSSPWQQPPWYTTPQSTGDSTFPTQDIPFPRVPGARHRNPYNPYSYPYSSAPATAPQGLP
jgi:serine/threonine-protein kinase